MRAQDRAFHSASSDQPLRRVDLHCHSIASSRTGESALKAIRCPESYSDPSDVYDQAKRRGMDFVVITDHDTIDGVLRIADRSDVLVGEELTCWFPEDDCKIHLLVYGITPRQHEDLQKLAPNIYDVAEYVERHRLAHSVAHPIYRQNEKLERWHLERLLLMFKGFECLNGAHSALHRDAFEPVLNGLTRQEMQRLAETHNMIPRWPEPWFKARTAGSDDHGLLNIGRTWTEFPTDCHTPGDLLECLRQGTCRPGGEAGSSAKLAHTFYSVGVRYYTHHLLRRGPTNSAITALQTIAGVRPKPTKLELARLYVKSKVRRFRTRLGDAIAGRKSNIYGTGSLRSLFLESARRHLHDYPDLIEALERGLPPLGEHDRFFDLIGRINRDVTRGTFQTLQRSIDDASFTGLFDSIGAALAQQFLLLPYYFACFHQNKERHLLRQITRMDAPRSAAGLKVGLFTDTLDDINGVARFIRDMAEQARLRERKLFVHTSCTTPRFEFANRINFQPLLEKPLPYYPDIKITLPPVLEVLEWADRQQFDVIHVSTPGPMGLCGWLAGKMLRVPVLGTYHTDFPAYVEKLTRDHRMVEACTLFMKWFYRGLSRVFSRSGAYRFTLMDLGVDENKLRTIQPGINLGKFRPDNADPTVWQRLGIVQPLRLLYAGRVSVEKNLPLLVQAFKALCERRDDVALVIAGDGPYLKQMRQELTGLPAYFLGYQNDEQLGALYASADLFVFPSRTDTLGQVVMESQASGLPALVSNEGGPKEMIDHNVTGLILNGTDASAWTAAMDELLNDTPRRLAMRAAATARMSRHSLGHTFESFWSEHLAAVTLPPLDDLPLHVSPHGAVGV